MLRNAIMNQVFRGPMLRKAIMRDQVFRGPMLRKAIMRGPGVQRTHGKAIMREASLGKIF
jgi:hypothetical protein